MSSAGSFSAPWMSVLSGGRLGQGMVICAIEAVSVRANLGLDAVSQ